MMRKANSDEVRVSVRDTGGRRRRGGSGWDERSQLGCQFRSGWS